MDDDHDDDDDDDAILCMGLQASARVTRPTHREKSGELARSKREKTTELLNDTLHGCGRSKAIVYFRFRIEIDRCLDLGCFLD